MKKTASLIALIVLLAFGSTGAWAGQASKVWVVPEVGQRISTSLAISSPGTDYSRIKLGNGLTYGLSVGFRLSETIAVEAMYNRSSTLIEGMITDPDPVNESLFKSFECQLHANFIIAAGYEIGPIKPYFLAGVGMTRLNPRTEVSGLTRFSWNLGMGFESMVGKKLGLRLQGKFVPTYISDVAEILSEWVGGFPTTTSRKTMTQWEITAGLIIHL